MYIWGSAQEIQFFVNIRDLFKKFPNFFFYGAILQVIEVCCPRSILLLVLYTFANFSTVESSPGK